MLILGLNNKIHGYWIVYNICNKSKYFYGAYLTKEKATEVADKIGGRYFYKD